MTGFSRKKKEGRGVQREIQGLNIQLAQHSLNLRIPHLWCSLRLCNKESSRSVVGNEWLLQVPRTGCAWVKVRYKINRETAETGRNDGLRCRNNVAQ
jgi:hypothetical protein